MPTGQLGTISRFNNLVGTGSISTTSYTYDAIDRITNLQHQAAGGTNISNYTYTYDAASRLQTETSNGTTKTYTYDNTNQLTADGTTTLTYDANGNRTNTGYSTGTGNQLLSDGTWNYTYDNEGNETKKTNIASGYYWKYSYDNLNHLTEADYYSNTNVLQKSVVFKYDAFGNRIEEDVTTTSTVTTRFALDGWNPAKGDAVGTENFDVWADMDGSNHVTIRYIRGDAVDQIFAREDSGGTVAWYLLDRLGSVRDMTDSNGTQKDHIDYDGWGNVINETSPTFSDRYKWTGREYDAATGLQYNRARFYDPTAGRWISQDPLGFDAGDGNLYRYVRNNPTDGEDASGLLPPPGAPPGTSWDFQNQIIIQFIAFRLTGMPFDLAMTSAAWSVMAKLQQPKAPIIVGGTEIVSIPRAKDGTEGFCVHMTGASSLIGIQIKKIIPGNMGTGHETVLGVIPISTIVDRIKSEFNKSEIHRKNLPPGTECDCKNGIKLNGKTIRIDLNGEKIFYWPGEPYFVTVWAQIEIKVGQGEICPAKRK